MRTLSAWILAGLAAATGWTQNRPEPWEPSPMEAFALSEGTHTAWSSEIGRMERGGVRATITALAVEDAAKPPKAMRGARIDLSGSNASDRIYLDEEAVVRTIKALGEASEGMAKANAQRRTGRGCFGAAEFWPLYNWPWNKYHELNANYCASEAGTSLVLTGRHKPASFQFPDQKPERLADMLKTALDQLKSH